MSEARIQQLEQELAALKRENALLRATFDANPDGITIMSLEGKLVYTNPIGADLARTPDPNAPLDKWTETYGIFDPDSMKPVPMQDLPIVKALHGNEATGDILIRNPAIPQGVTISVLARPLTLDGKPAGAMAVFKDVGAKRAMEKELAARNEELMRREQEKTELISRLRLAIDELSTPILELWDEVLAMPVIGVVDSRRSAEMVERLLQEVVQSQAQYVIVDLTGVEVIDTKTADHFIKLVRAVELIGARCVLTGIRPAVAQTLVELGVEFGKLSTLRNLKHALRQCMAERHQQSRAVTDVNGALGGNGRGGNGRAGSGDA